MDYSKMQKIDERVRVGKTLSDGDLVFATLFYQDLFDKLVSLGEQYTIVAMAVYSSLNICTGMKRERGL